MPHPIPLFPYVALAACPMIYHVNIIPCPLGSLGTQGHRSVRDTLDVYILDAIKIIIVANGSLMSTARLCPKITGVRLRLPHTNNPPSINP